MTMDMKTAASMADTYTDFHGLARLRNQAQRQSPQALRETAQQFEGIMLQMMLRSMRQASGMNSLMDSQQSRFYRDLFDQQLADRRRVSRLTDIDVVQHRNPRSTEVDALHSLGQTLSRRLHQGTMRRHAHVQDQGTLRGSTSLRRELARSVLEFEQREERDQVEQGRDQDEAHHRGAERAGGEGVLGPSRRNWFERCLRYFFIART